MDFYRLIDFLLSNLDYFSLDDIYHFFNGDFWYIYKSFNNKFLTEKDPKKKQKYIEILYGLEELKEDYKKNAYKYNYSACQKLEHYVYWYDFYLKNKLFDKVKEVLKDIRKHTDDVNFYRKLVKKYEEEKKKYEESREKILKEIEYEQKIWYIDYLISKGEYSAAISEILHLLKDYPGDKNLLEYLQKIDDFKRQKEIDDIKYSEEVLRKLWLLEKFKVTDAKSIQEKDFKILFNKLKQLKKNKDYEGGLSLISYLEDRLKLSDPVLLKYKEQFLRFKREAVKKRQEESFKLELKTLEFLIENKNYDEAIRKIYSLLRKYPFVDKKQLLKRLEKIYADKIKILKKWNKWIENKWENFLMRFSNLTKKWLFEFYEKMAWFLKWKMDIKFALDVVYSQTKDLGLKKFVRDLREWIDNGIKLSEIMSWYPQISKLDVAMIKIAENTWKLGEIFYNIYTMHKEEEERRKKIKSVLTYPAVVIFITIAIFIWLLVFIIPKFVMFYNQVNVPLPFITQILIDLSYFIRDKWPLLVLGLVGFIVLLKIFLKTEVWQYAMSRLTINLPIVKEIVRRKYIIFFTATLSLLLKSWVNLLDALDLIIEGTENKLFQDEFKRIRFELESGNSLSKIIWLTDQSNISNYKNIFIPVDVAYSIDIWEKTWQLSVMLWEIAQRYDEDLRLIIKTLQNLMEPFVIVLVWGVVFIFILAIFLPMIHIYDIIGKMGRGR